MSETNRGLRLLILIVTVVMLLGLIALGVTGYMAGDLARHLLRDFGIACFISAFVTIAYEAYSRHRFDLEKIRTLLDTVYGSGITEEIWNDIKKTLLSRTVMRKGAVLHIRIEKIASQADLVALDLNVEYDLVAIADKLGTVNAYHGLDNHITRQGIALPKFISASTGDLSYLIDAGSSWKSTDNLVEIDAAGTLALPVDLGQKAQGCSPVQVRRKEIRNYPGSYYLIMTELTANIRIHLDECPPDLQVKLVMRPTEDECDLSEIRYRFYDYPLLPGHGLEFQLIPRP